MIDNCQKILHTTSSCPRMLVFKSATTFLRTERCSFSEYYYDNV
jgi:hypothetical protein